MWKAQTKTSEAVSGRYPALPSHFSPDTPSTYVNLKESNKGELRYTVFKSYLDQKLSLHDCTPILHPGALGALFVLVLLLLVLSRLIFYLRRRQRLQLIRLGHGRSSQVWPVEAFSRRRCSRPRRRSARSFVQMGGRRWRVAGHRPGRIGIRSLARRDGLIALLGRRRPSDVVRLGAPSDVLLLKMG